MQRDQGPAVVELESNTMSVGECGVDRRNRLLVRMFLVFGLIAVTSSAPIRSQTDSPPPKSGQAAAPQDPVEELRRSEAPYFEVRQRVANELWADEKIRAQVIALTLDPALAPNVLIGIGMVCADKRERGVVANYLELISNGRLKPTEKETIREYVILVFHKVEGVFPDIDSALERHTGDEAKFAALVTLYDYLVDGLEFHKQRPGDIERYEAVQRLLALWKSLGARISKASVDALRDVLARICDSAVQFPTLAEWDGWFERYRVKNRDTKSLGLSEIYRDLLADERARNTDLLEARRREASLLIQRMKQDGEPPVGFLDDSDSDIRKVALLTLAGMADGLAAPARKVAVDGIVERLNDESLSLEIYSDLVEAAGSLGRHASAEDKASLSAAVFVRTLASDAKLLKTQLRSVGEIGLLDDPTRLDGIYDAALVGSRATDKDWGDLRSSVIRVIEVLQVREKLALKAITDPDPSVREVAAVVLGGLADRFQADPGVDLAAELGARAAQEENATARRRMLEALGKVVAQRAELLTTAVLTDLTKTYRYDDDPTRLLVVGILVQGSRLPSLDAAMAEGLTVVFNAAIADSSSAKLREGALVHLTKEPSPFVLDLMSKWFDGRPPGGADWTRVRDLMVVAFAGDRSRLWKMAETLSSQGAGLAFDEAAAIGEIVVSSVESKPDGILTPILPECREKLVTWLIGGARPTSWESAVSRLTKQLDANPALGKQLRLRSEVRERLAAQAATPDAASILLRAAEADLTAALDTDLVGLGEQGRAPLWRRLAGLRFDLGLFTRAAAAITALDELKQATGDDYYLQARALICDRGGDKALARSRLAALSLETVTGIGKTKVALAKAAAILLDDDLDEFPKAKTILGSLEAVESPLRLGLAARLYNAPEIARLVAEATGTRSLNAKLDLLNLQRSFTARRLFLRLGELGESEAELGKALLGLLKGLYKGDAGIEAIAWPTSANGESGSNLVQALEVWWRSSRPVEKITTLFLKGT